MPFALPQANFNCPGWSAVCMQKAMFHKTILIEVSEKEKRGCDDGAVVHMS